MKQKETSLTRSDLISLLSEACELEHGLACSYLYSAFTLKQSMSESDLTLEQFQFTRKWAGQLYFIASQEMFHLSQAWNLLTAIGGSPYYMRPNFPQGHKYYPIDLPLTLEPFGKKALKRFTFYELPTHVSDIEFLKKEFNIKEERINKAYTVGKLYTKIKEGFSDIAESTLFVGNKNLQVGSDVCHFNEIVKVVDRKSAVVAIETIMEQGEGTSNNQMNCHYGLFVTMDKEFDLLSAKAIKIKFSPSRNTIENPMPAFHNGDGPKHANSITEPFTNEVTIFFDNVYSLMLRMLQYVFQSGPLPHHMQQRLADCAIQIMTRALKPLGESLTFLPAGEKYKNKTCGPAFGLYRHVAFPSDYVVTILLIRERFMDLIEIGKRLSNNELAPLALKEGVVKLENISLFIMGDEVIKPEEHLN